MQLETDVEGISAFLASKGVDETVREGEGREGARGKRTDEGLKGGGGWVGGVGGERKGGREEGWERGREEGRESGSQRERVEISNQIFPIGY